MSPPLHVGFIQNNSFIIILKLKYIKKLIALLLITSFSACVVVPKVSVHQEAKCKLYTKKLSLGWLHTSDSKAKAKPSPKETSQKSGSGGFWDRFLTEIIARTVGMVIIPLFAIVGGVIVVSTVISGSIVLIGNTLHWIEEKNKCTNSVKAKAVSKLRAKALKEGGKTIDTKEDALALIALIKKSKKKRKQARARRRRIR